MNNSKTKPLMYLNPYADMEYKKSIEQYNKHKNEYMAFWNELFNGLKQLDKIKQIGNKDKIK